MKASILDLRRRMSDILKALDRHESVVLTYRGKQKATILPKVSRSISDATDHPAFGLWKKRNDVKDVDQAVRTLRKRRFYAF